MATKPKPPPYRAKATVWTPTIRSEFSGSITGCISLMFMAVDSANARAKLIESLQEYHAKRVARETAPAEKNPPGSETA